jgi:cysteine desulfurase/selenocysteine lyase
MGTIDALDPAAIAKLAGELFANWPGAAPQVPQVAQAPANVHPAGVTPPPGSTGPATPNVQPLAAAAPGANLAPSSPQHPAALAAQWPSSLPHAPAGNGVPDLGYTAAPAWDGRFGSSAAGVAPLASSTPSFYFLETPRHPGQRALGAASHAAPVKPAFDVHAVRRDFPILQERVNGRQLVWFDNAATTQKPQQVIDRLSHFYAHENSNIHRAAHELAARATDAYEGARKTVQRFLGAASVDEIVFVRGTTEAINLVARSWGAKHIGAGDEIIVSHLEHHANIVPWQQLATDKGAVLRVIPVDDRGQLRLDEYRKLLGPRTKLVAVTQVSNALGTVVPVQEIVALAHQAGAKALVDGAQSVSHMRVDVRAIDADFFVFSGHKLFGPTGIGVLYGKQAILEDMPPWQGGGNMIADVTFEKTVYHGAPTRFEAGTGNIADAVGLGAAIDYVQRLGLDAIAQYEHALLGYATQALQPIAGVRLVGTADDKASVLSFVLDGYSTEQVGQALNREGIAVRTGHHCAQPILRRFGLEATVRPSLAFYNTCDEVDRFIAVIRQLANRR